MRICKNIEQWKPVPNPVITVGSFDGVHCAHKSIINLLNKEAEALSGESVLVSFTPHPRTVLDTDDNFRKQFRLLTTDNEKEELLGESGLQNLVLINFDLNFAAMSAEDFVKDILVNRLRIKKAIVGYNHFFGHGREGNFEQMCKWGKEFGFQTEEFPEYMVQEEHVSSSHIRQFLKDGHIEEANKLLGYNYFIHGSWQQGIFEPSSMFKLQPPPGNYLTKVRVKDRYYYSICNIQEEIHFPDLFFLQEGDNMKIRFIKEIRL